MIKPSFTLRRFSLPGFSVEVVLGPSGLPDSVSTEGFKEPLSAVAIERIATLLKEQRAQADDDRSCCVLHGYQTIDSTTGYACSVCVATEREQQEAQS